MKGISPPPSTIINGSKDVVIFFDAVMNLLFYLN